MESSRRRSWGPREGGSSWTLRDRPTAGLAHLVRGSSRRITIMTARLLRPIREYQCDQPSRWLRDRRRLGSPSPPNETTWCLFDRSFHISVLFRKFAAEGCEGFSGLPRRDDDGISRSYFEEEQRGQA